MRRVIALFTALSAVGLAVPATAAQTTAVANVKIIKPVILSKVQDMDFGTLTFAGFTGTRNIVLSRTGVLTCAADIVCSGTARQARFNAQGTNREVVVITYSGGTLSNGTDSIPFTPDGAASITMTNSGAPGLDFDVGGTLQIAPTLVGGTYTGTMTVTAEYQ